MPQKGTEKRRSSENLVGTDKSALLWMYCREIAPFETPTFNHKVGELIARAASTPRKRTTYLRQTRTYGQVKRAIKERDHVGFHRTVSLDHVRITVVSKCADRRSRGPHRSFVPVISPLEDGDSLDRFAPRPAQVSPAGLRYFGGIFLPLIELTPRPLRRTRSPLNEPILSNCSSMSARRLRSSSSTCFRKLMSDVKSFAIDLALPWLPPKNVLRYSQANASRTPMPIAIPETHPGRAWPSRYASGEQSVQSVWE